MPAIRAGTKRRFFIFCKMMSRFAVVRHHWMLPRKFILGFGCLCTVLLFTTRALAAAQIENLAVGYSSLAGHHTPMWIAVEDRIGRKYGIDLKAIYAGRLRPQQLLM